MNSIFSQCVEIKENSDYCEISCKLGLWSVSAPTFARAMIEGSCYFIQYYGDGEYDEFLQGLSAGHREKVKS